MGGGAAPGGGSRPQPPAQESPYPGDTVTDVVDGAADPVQDVVDGAAGHVQDPVGGLLGR